MAIPARFKKGVADVRAAYDAYRARSEREPAPGLKNKAFKALAALVKQIGLDRASHPETIEAAELTADQRAVLVALCEMPWIPVRAVAAVPAPWPMRRWLGLAPPGILEELGLDRSKTTADLERGLAKVPANRRVEALVEALLANFAFETRPLFETLQADAPAALDYARATLPRVVDPPNLAAVALFTVFSANNVTVPEGADEKFPLAYRLPGLTPSEPTSTALLVENFLAIAEPRRDAVLAAALRNRANGMYEAAMHLLEHCGPLPRTHDAVQRYLTTTRKKRLTPYETKALAALEKRMKALSSTGKPRASAAKPTIARTLDVTARHSPRSDADVTPIQARQLVETGRRWDDQKLAATRRLSLDENDEGALGAMLEHVTIADSGKPMFEAWLHGDSGTFFASGTTKVVAVRGDSTTVLEGGDDEALVAALSKIGPSKAAIRSVRDVKRATTTKKKRPR